MRCVLGSIRGYKLSFLDVFAMKPEQYKQGLKEVDREQNRKVTSQEGFTDTAQVTLSTPSITRACALSSKLRAVHCLPFSTIVETSSPTLT